MYISLYKRLKLKFDFIWNWGGELKKCYIFGINYYIDRNIFCKYIIWVCICSILCKIYIEYFFF